MSEGGGKLTLCTKNPGHKNFKHLDEFGLKDLPEGYQDNKLYLLIMAAAALTVNVIVKETSSDRPDNWPSKPDFPYPFRDNRGQSNIRVGSGRVWFVKMFHEGKDEDGNGHELGYITCPCGTCVTSSTPSPVWWEVRVATATHVVFDNIEANHMKLRLFFDKEDSPEIIIDDVVSINANIDDDRCNLKCVTCDSSVGLKLQELVRSYENLWKVVYEKYKKTKLEDSLVFIVSHPHGCHKRISIGRYKDKIKVGEDIFNHQFSYTTDTCPGSSGASIHIVGTTVGWWSYMQHVHSGTIGTEENFSSVGYVK